MQNYTLELNDEEAVTLREAAAERGANEQQFLASIVDTFLRREALKKQMRARTYVPDERDHLEDRQLAECAAASAVKRLQEEDEA